MMKIERSIKERAVNIIEIGALVLVALIFSLYLSSLATIIVYLAGIELDSFCVFVFLNTFFNAIFFTYFINLLLKNK